MNLRQKAKKYKQRCQQLESMCLPIKPYHLHSNTYPVITLETMQIIELDGYNTISTGEDFYAIELNKILARNLLHDILNYAEITTEEFGFNKQLIKARMKVVDMSKLN